MKTHVCKACGEVFPSADDHVAHLLVRREGRGVGSTEIRTKGISGNPSQRINDLRGRGMRIVAARRRHPQGHVESHYVLERFAAVRPASPESSPGRVTVVMDIRTVQARRALAAALDYAEARDAERAAERRAA